MSAPTISLYGISSPYIGSPVVFQMAPTGAGTGKTFYQMKLKVVARLGSNDNQVFDFSTPIETKTINNVETAQNVIIDISSALRAVAEQWEPVATAEYITYPTVSFYLEAKEEWMIDGSIYSSDTSRYPGSTGTSTMYMGALTDYERISGRRPTRYSRKPSSSNELCFMDSYVIVPGPTSEPPHVTLYLAGDPGEQALSSLNYYVIPPPPNGCEIRFVNSLGVHENIFTYGLPQKKTNITTEQHVIAKQETLTQFSRGLAIKKNDYEIWELTSGPIDEQWASWYVHEFLMSRWLWIKIGEHYIPCHVLPEETTLLTDRITPARHEVQFKIQLDINGSPL